MRLSDYIQGLRKGKEAHRLEKESMKDPFLADAIDGYNQVEGNHEQRIEKLRMQVSAHSDNSTKGNRTSSHKDKDGFHSYFPSFHETSG